MNWAQTLLKHLTCIQIKRCTKRIPLGILLILSWDLQPNSIPPEHLTQKNWKLSPPASKRKTISLPHRLNRSLGLLVLHIPCLACRCKGEVEMCVISILLTMPSKTMDDPTQPFHVLYILNSIGEKIEPRGTPHWKLHGAEKHSPSILEQPPK